MLVAGLHLPVGWRCIRTDLTFIHMLLQASAGGDSVVPLYWNLGQARDVFWARYVDWFLTVSITRGGSLQFMIS
jgi:bacteriorhodopsin